MARHALTVIN